MILDSTRDYVWIQEDTVTPEIPVESIRDNYVFDLEDSVTHFLLIELMKEAWSTYPGSAGKVLGVDIWNDRLSDNSWSVTVEMDNGDTLPVVDGCESEGWAIVHALEVSIEAINVQRVEVEPPARGHSPQPTA